MTKNNIIEFWKTGENPITCYTSKGMQSETDQSKNKISKANEPVFNLGVPITVIDKEGNINHYISVLQASDAINIPTSALYAYLNGHRKNNTEYKIFKS
jgi:hypothetical protein